MSLRSKPSACAPIGSASKVETSKERNIKSPNEALDMDMIFLLKM
jgi:hypothetical protein